MSYNAHLCHALRIVIQTCSNLCVPSTLPVVQLPRCVSLPSRYHSKSNSPNKEASPEHNPCPNLPSLGNSALLTALNAQIVAHPAYAKNAVKVTYTGNNSTTRKHCRPTKKPCVWTHSTSMPGTAKAQHFITREIIAKPWMLTIEQPTSTPTTLSFG